MAEKFLLIDGSSLIHRAFFALPPLTTKKGVNTGAVYGFCNMLLKLLTDMRPDYVVIAFDKSRQTFRRAKYKEYKAQRKPTPTELSEQFPLAMDLFKKMGINTLELDDYEADDIIGTLSAAAPKDMEVYIVTGDKDEFQLIQDNVKVLYTKRGISDIVIYDKAEFAKNYEGLAPKQIIDLKGLMGDTSDNIPGVPGVGPKTALKLLVEYQSVENVLANIDKVKGKSLKEKLTVHKDMAVLSKDLATICLETPVDTAFADYKLKGMSGAAKTMFQDLQFRNFWEKFAPVLGLQPNAGEASTSTEGENGALFGISDLDAGQMGLFGTVEAAPSYPRKEITDSSLLAAILMEVKNSKEVIPLTYEIKGDIPDLQLAGMEILFNKEILVLGSFIDNWTPVYNWLEDQNAPKALCDGKNLYKIMLCQQKQLSGIKEDVALAGYLYEPGDTAYDLKAMAERYLPGDQGGTVEDLAKLLPVMKELLQERELTKLYQEIEMPLIEILAKMEFTGIRVDEKMLDRVTVEMSEKVSELEKLAEEQAGEAFNLKSPKQLGILLFEKLGLPIIKKTKTGYSTDVSVLEELLGKHPIIETILEHRKLSKLLSTYLLGLKPLINKKTGHIHTHFQQMVTVTGRLSSTEPNLQNIPTRTEVGKRMREMFVPSSGYDWLLSCDYSQVELRVMASIAQDHLLIDSFNKGQDVHARTASEVFGVPLEDVTPTMRSRAKTVNFGIVYGISDYGLAQQLGVSRAEAGKYIADYFARYTGVKEYMNNEIAKAKKWAM
jgi:DNA polymerase-1